MGNKLIITIFLHINLLLSQCLGADNCCVGFRNAVTSRCQEIQADCQRDGCCFYGQSKCEGCIASFVTCICYHKVCPHSAKACLGSGCDRVCNCCRCYFEVKEKCGSQDDIEGLNSKSMM